MKNVKRKKQQPETQWSQIKCQWFRRSNPCLRLKWHHPYSNDLDMAQFEIQRPIGKVMRRCVRIQDLLILTISMLILVNHLCLFYKEQLGKWFLVHTWLQKDETWYTYPCLTLKYFTWYNDSISKLFCYFCFKYLREFRKIDLKHNEEFEYPLSEFSRKKKHNPKRRNGTKYWYRKSVYAPNHIE